MYVQFRQKSHINYDVIWGKLEGGGGGHVFVIILYSPLTKKNKIYKHIRTRTQKYKCVNHRTQHVQQLQCSY
jgi:hypothetical protein